MLLQKFQRMGLKLKPKAENAELDKNDVDEKNHKDYPVIRSTGNR
jgi:hypothetical protein